MPDSTPPEPRILVGHVEGIPVFAADVSGEARFFNRKGELWLGDRRADIVIVWTSSSLREPDHELRRESDTEVLLDPLLVHCEQSGQAQFTPSKGDADLYECRVEGDKIAYGADTLFYRFDRRSGACIVEFNIYDRGYIEWPPT